MKKLLIFSIITLFAVSCIPEDARDTAARQQREMAETAKVAVPIPTVSYFQEKRTIANWAKRWDRPNIPTYVYLVSFGKVLGYYVADGKPASTRSYIMPEEQVVSVSAGLVVGAPDIDGTYGDNNAGIRFFTAEGAAVEWAGDGASYLYSDAPINFGYDVPRLRPAN